MLAQRGGVCVSSALLCSLIMIGEIAGDDSNMPDLYSDESCRWVSLGYVVVLCVAL